MYVVISWDYQRFIKIFKDELNKLSEIVSGILNFEVVSSDAVVIGLKFVLQNCYEYVRNLENFFELNIIVHLLFGVLSWRCFNIILKFSFVRRFNANFIKQLFVIR